MDKVIITGSAGFIGFHLSKLLLSEGYNVLGIDNYDNYYDLKLKRDRTKILLSNDNYSHEELDITTANFIQRCLRYKPKIIIHLAAVLLRIDSTVLWQALMVALVSPSG